MPATSLFPLWPSYTGWFDPKKELEAWLVEQPIQITTVLAYRIGARCLPALRAPRDPKQDASPYDARDRRHVMAAFRSLAVSRLYIRHPSQALRFAASDLSKKVNGSGTVTSSVIFESCKSVFSASSIQTNPKYVPSSIRSAVLAARGAHQVLADPLTGRTGTGRFWPAIAADATWLAARPDPMALLNEPLWLGSDEASQPIEEIAALWATLRAALEEHDQNWSVWTHWYQKQLDGTLDEPLALELYRLTLIPDAEARIQAITNGPQFLSSEDGTSRLSWNEQDPANQQWLEEVGARAKLYSGDPKRANRMVRTFFDEWAEAHAQPDAVERKAVTSDKANGAYLSDEEIRSLLRRQAEESIAFRPLFPPDFTRSSLTFFGGLPIAPPGFPWPKAPQEPQDPASLASLMFLGQIDCRTLPDIPSRDLLPRTGHLYFFVDWLLVEGAVSYPTPYDNVVVYQDGDMSDAVEQTPPEDLVFCYGRDRDCYYSWLSRTSPETRTYPKAFPKWTMEPVRLCTLKDEIPSDVDDASIEHAHALRKEEQHQALIEAFGEPVSPQTGSVPEPMSGMWRPSARFPEAWLFVEILAGEMLHRLHRRPSSFGRLPGAPAPSPEKLEARAAACREATRQASEWVETTRRNGLYCAVSDADRSAVLRWLEALAAPLGVELERAFSVNEINGMISKAVQEGTSSLLSHSAETAALIGEDLRALTLYRHRTFVNDAVKSTTRHQMLGTGLAIQDAVERYGESHVLLAQFDSDAGLGWMWGDLGALQFWITPEDLAARRFD